MGIHSAHQIASLSTAPKVGPGILRPTLGLTLRVSRPYTGRMLIPS